MSALPTPYYQDSLVTLFHGRNEDILPLLAAESFHAVVTDPPYFLTNCDGHGFMNATWDSLSPAHAVVVAVFKSMKLVCDTDEAKIVALPVNTLSSHPQQNSTSAQSVKSSLSETPHCENRNTLSVPALVITKAEALALCCVLSPNLTTILQSLPDSAYFVSPPLTDEGQPGSIARRVADTWLESPVWLENVTTFSCTGRAKQNLSEEMNGHGLEKTSIAEISGLVSDAIKDVGKKKSNATILHPGSTPRTINQIISSPYVSHVTRMCMRSPSFLSLLSESLHRAWAKNAYRVLKPGGHLLAFGGTRTYHRLASALEDAGFDLRETVAWIFASGFPKSLNVSKQLQKIAPENTEAARQFSGFGTALKPAFEPIILARKPLIGTIVENILEHSCGALNIDASRIETDTSTARTSGINQGIYGADNRHGMIRGGSALGRYPSNLTHDGSPEVLAEFAKAGERSSGGGNGVRTRLNTPGWGMNAQTVTTGTPPDTGSAARFFYCSKSSASEREADLGDMTPTNGTRRNIHSTVKPLKLLRYLIKLILPPGGILIDPFCGSGSTLLAAKSLGFRCVGIEQEETYCEIAARRLRQGVLPFAAPPRAEKSPVPPPQQGGLFDEREP